MLHKGVAHQLGENSNATHFLNEVKLTGGLVIQGLSHVTELFKANYTGRNTN